MFKRRDVCLLSSVIQSDGTLLVVETPSQEGEEKKNSIQRSRRRRLFPEKRNPPSPPPSSPGFGRESAGPLSEGRPSAGRGSSPLLQLRISTPLIDAWIRVGGRVMISTRLIQALTAEALWRRLTCLRFLQTCVSHRFFGSGSALPSAI